MPSFSNLLLYLSTYFKYLFSKRFSALFLPKFLDIEKTIIELKNPDYFIKKTILKKPNKMPMMAIKGVEGIKIVPIV